jgi:hypothetical protein
MERCEKVSLAQAKVNADSKNFNDFHPIGSQYTHATGTVRAGLPEPPLRHHPPEE